MSNLIFISIALFLVFVDALFVAAEFSIIKIRNTQIKAIEDSKKFI